MGIDPASRADPEPRRILFSILEQALQAVNGRRRVRSALANERAAGAWRVIAIGKAASAMTLGAHDALGQAMTSALVISRDGHFDAELATLPRVTQLASGHPIPDERSLAAGRELIDAIRAASRGERLLFLISGGASSLVEVLRPGSSLADLRRLNVEALMGGLAIDEINARRAALSLIKAGGLLRELEGRDVLACYLSDVPGDDPATIGSGLLGPAAPVPEPEPELRIERRIVGTSADAVRAAAGAGAALGLNVQCDSRRFAGDAIELATRFCHELILGRAQVFVWGGESTARLPIPHGRGGRNQHLALAAARLLTAHEGLALMAIGTDGTDGNTEDAGAVVDAGTLERGTLDGLDADECLQRADSATFLEASGDLVHTGPTGTNVGDLVLGLRLGPSRVNA